MSASFNAPVGPRRLVCRESSLGFSFSHSYHPRVYIPLTNSKPSAYTLLRLSVCFLIALPDICSVPIFTGNLFLPSKCVESLLPAFIRPREVLV